MIDLQAIQTEVGKWSQTNFGDNPPGWKLLGVVEEVGELCHAELKGLQGIRHSVDEIHSLKVDAIGDIVIYLLDYCYKSGISFEYAIQATWRNIVSKRDWVDNPMGAGDGGS